MLLHDAEGLTVREIADIHGIELPAAKQRLRRGRMLMVNALADAPARAAELETIPMDCWNARSHISDFIDGLLEQQLARTVQRHLEGCPTCPPLYAALVDGVAAAGRLRDADSLIPPVMTRRLGPQ